MKKQLVKQVQELMNATCGSKDIGIGINDSHGLNHKGNNFITSGMWSFSLRSTLSPLGFKVVNGEGVPH